MASKQDRKDKTEQKSKKGQEGGKSAPAAEEKKERVPCRLQLIYKKDIVPSLMKKFDYKSVMEVPKLVKVTINFGVGDAVSDPKLLEEAIKDLEAITGQKPSVRKSKKAISNFKLRQGINIGAMVTLRKENMYEFLDRFINIALPRVRDFRGLSDKSFDGRGNYTIGIKEQIIFPEINVDKVVKILGMDISFVTTAKTDNEAFELFTAFGFPFRKKEVRA
ncbi:MAG: 50S ribosomal protein L5 [Ignavibacteriaceae bacterium]|nr:50S ribosomal protein L5 [Ignavibacteriaceae bacterium]